MPLKHRIASKSRWRARLHASAISVASTIVPKPGMEETLIFFKLTVRHLQSFYNRLYMEYAATHGRV